MRRLAFLALLPVAACGAPPAEGPAAAPRALFNGRDLSGWHADVPAADGGAVVKPSFVVRDGLLVSQGTPEGHLITDESFHDYRLVVEWRWPGEPGNCGILVHTSTPRRLYEMFPQSIECQLHAGNAGDFWCIGEDVTVPDMEKRRGPRERWGVDGDRARRIVNLTDGSEKPAGEWNEMVIECREQTGVTSVVVTHDMASARRIADKIVMLYEGEVIEEAPPDAFMESENPIVQQFVRGELEGPITDRLRELERQRLLESSADSTDEEGGD